MNGYVAPVEDQIVALEHIADISALMPGDDTAEEKRGLLRSILEQSARLAESEFAPLNRIGDMKGATLSGGGVALPPGFVAAYAAYAEAGWSGIGAKPEHGGMGLPVAIISAIEEHFMSANLALSLGPVLTIAAIEAIEQSGTDKQKADFLPPLVAGDWLATMCMTEPQAGSDLGALRCQALPRPDGDYAIKGSKIFITWGEHNATANIVHLVLARLPEAPEGTKGISLFLVPKLRQGADGRFDQSNDVSCASIEHKLGIRGSPTCTMNFGDNDDCVGYLVGEPHRGLPAMFAMMNPMRINVAVQGVAVAERALQMACRYAVERKQSRDPLTGATVAIIDHVDVRRMLLTMRALTEGARALVVRTAAAVDRGRAGDTAEAALADLLTPVAKIFATDAGVKVADQAIQVFGGMGFVEETGIAQLYRDARIAPIYEGTNGIQAIDVVTRKLGNGAWDGWLDEIAGFAANMPTQDYAIGKQNLIDATKALRKATEFITSNKHNSLATGLENATPYARLFGAVSVGYLLSKLALAAKQNAVPSEGGDVLMTRKDAVARFFLEQLLPAETGLSVAICAPTMPLRDLNAALLAA
jgi:3-(methylthio)propanoyl-CoA dehydrogenase